LPNAGEWQSKGVEELVTGQNVSIQLGGQFGELGAGLFEVAMGLVTLVNERCEQ
jgi:hypothetical protein